MRITLPIDMKNLDGMSIGIACRWCVPYPNVAPDPSMYLESSRNGPSVPAPYLMMLYPPFANMSYTSSYCCIAGLFVPRMNPIISPTARGPYVSALELPKRDRISLQPPIMTPIFPTNAQIGQPGPLEAPKREDERGRSAYTCRSWRALACPAGQMALAWPAS